MNSTPRMSGNMATRESDLATAKEAAGETLNRAKEELTNAASTLGSNPSVDLEGMRRDLNSLKDTLSRFVSQAGEVSSSVASQVSDAASSFAESGTNMASAAKEQAKTFASELEAIGRRNPLGAMAAALVVGVLIGLIGRGRSNG
jgi:ElaB/YqjD/DUF883 family membrane-anchored ribosome-binding protein